MPKKHNNIPPAVPTPFQTSDPLYFNKDLPFGEKGLERVDKGYGKPFASMTMCRYRISKKNYIKLLLAFHSEESVFNGLPLHIKYKIEKYFLMESDPLFARVIFKMPASEIPLHIKNSLEITMLATNDFIMNEFNYNKTIL